MPKPYLIGGKQLGLQTNVKPFWLPDQAYAVLENCFAWRDRIRKKPGWRLLGRLRRAVAQNLGNFTTPWQSFSGTLTSTQVDISSLQVRADATITGATQANPCVLTVTNNFNVNQRVFISGVGGMTALNGNTYTISARTGLNITINVDSTAFGAYTAGGTASVYGQVYRTITGITSANPAVVTSVAHGLLNSSVVLITGVEGMLDSDGNSGINGQLYTVANRTADTFELSGFDSSTLTAYDSSGIAQTLTNLVTGSFTVQFDPPFLGDVTLLADYFYYPALPVLGIVTQELTDINSENGVFFDTTYAYDFVGSQFVEFPSNTPTTWTNPQNANLFWFTNYYATALQTQALWVTNNIDNIRYYNLASSPLTWTNFAPPLTSGGGTNLNSCLLLTPFKSRLLAFNTLEGGDRFRQRLRFSKSSLRGPPTAADAWYSDVPGLGGFIDAPTAESIMSLKNLKDRLIVYFENSTWEVVYTGSETLPFVFRQLNQELGSESTFSSVPFDNGILAIGNVGVHTCNGVNVVRFDEEIPDEVFKINNLNQGPERVCGIRDYQLETVYWTYPDPDQFDGDATNLTFPNKMFVFNYRNNTWAEFIESFTVFGYFQPATDFTWDTLPYENWDEWDQSWNSGLPNARNPLVCAGNQQGFVFSFDKEEASATDYSRYISAISGNQVTSPNHNLNENDYIVFNYTDILGTVFNQTTLSFQITNIIDEDNFLFDGTVTGTYLGNGLIKKLDNFQVSTKEFNPFVGDAQSVRFSSVDFLVDAQTVGGFEAKFYLNDSEAVFNDALTGTNEIDMRPSALVPMQTSQDTIWKRKNINAVGQFIQITMDHSDAQMRDPLISQEQFILHGLNIRLDASGRINPS